MNCTQSITTHHSYLLMNEFTDELCVSNTFIDFALPQLGVKIIKQLTTSDLSKPTLAKLLIADPSACAKLVTAANYPRFSTGREATTIQDAVARLGFRLTVRLCENYWHESVAQLRGIKTPYVRKKIRELMECSALSVQLAIAWHGVLEKYDLYADENEKELVRMCVGLQYAPIIGAAIKLALMYDQFGCKPSEVPLDSVIATLLNERAEDIIHASFTHSCLPEGLKNILCGDQTGRDLPDSGVSGYLSAIRYLTRQTLPRIGGFGTLGINQGVAEKQFHWPSALSGVKKKELLMHSGEVFKKACSRLR